MALITFQGQLHSYTLLLTDGGDALKVGETFKKMGLDKQGYSNTRRASEVATQFLRLYENAVLTERTVASIHECYYKLLVPSLTLYAWKAYRGKEDAFHGTITTFLSWPENAAETVLRNSVEKVVKFNYKGGSHVGKQRIVKLKAVIGTGKNLLFKGWDVVQSTGDKPAYRSYRLANVVGQIEVVG